jgi:mono/diheme cytochrome c family protein
MPAVVGVLIGLVLLVILGLAVAYATGLGARPATAASTAPDADADGAANVGPERKAQLAIAVTIAVGVITLIYGLNEPHRQAEAIERQRHLAMERGAGIYARLCYTCHGYTGTGAIVPGAEVMAANLSLRRATGDRDEDRKTFDFLTKTIARGRPNTPMPAWGLRDGGALNDEEIDELATWIMNAGSRWNEIEELTHGGPTPIMPDVGGTGADAVARGLFLSKGCGACHTIQGLQGANGQVGPNLSQVGTVAGTRKGLPAAEYIRESILQPAAFLAPGFQNLMPPFQGQVTDDELSALVSWLSSLGTDQGPQGGTAGAVQPTAGPGGQAGGSGQPSPAQAPGGQITTPSGTPTTAGTQTPP